MAVRHVIYSGLFALVCGAAPALADPAPGDTVDLRFHGTVSDGSTYDALLGQSLPDTLGVTLDFQLQYNLGSVYLPGSPFSELYGGDPTYPGTVSPVLSGTVTFDGFAPIALSGTPDMSSYLSIDTSASEFYVTWSTNTSTMTADFFSPDIPADFFTLTPTFSGDGFGEFGFKAKIGEVQENFFDDFSLDAMSISGVPEPASWVLFLAAFGALGVALRSRRVAA
jgi:hypothetical protein